MTSLKEKIDTKYKKYLEDVFYYPLGISDTILALLKSMNNFLQQLKNEINKIKFRLSLSPNYYRSCDSFKYLDN